ncbi:MAG TPA: hypothetical protein VK747_02455 [Blastocatellia bacterium]|nr:hypothetical protein [Blastocatellia bacterium]
MHNAKWSMSRRSVSLLLFALLLVAAASFAQAQSGRRIPKQPDSSERNPPSQPEPPTQPSPRETAPLLPILAVKNLQTVGSSSIFTDIALGGCLEELKQSTAVQVSSGKDKNRKEASDYAKASKDTYVVLIQLESDTFDTMGGNPRSFYVSYVAFAPGTGKIKTQGHIYQGQSRGPVGVPTSGSIEFELRRCGREAADRVLEALNLSRPKRH